MESDDDGHYLPAARTWDSFIKARLSEDEYDALAAGGPNERWEADDGSVVRGYFTDQVADYIDGESAPHVARQDPAATLARVAALRALVAHHGPIWQTTGDAPPRCYVCETHWWPCETLRHVAAIWRNHPDWREDWSP